MLTKCRGLQIRSYVGGDTQAKVPYQMRINMRRSINNPLERILWFGLVRCVADWMHVDVN